MVPTDVSSAASLIHRFAINKLGMKHKNHGQPITIKRAGLGCVIIFVNLLSIMETYRLEFHTEDLLEANKFRYVCIKPKLHIPK